MADVGGDLRLFPFGLRWREYLRNVFLTNCFKVPNCKNKAEWECNQKKRPVRVYRPLLLRFIYAAWYGLDN